MFLKVFFRIIYFLESVILNFYCHKEAPIFIDFDVKGHLTLFQLRDGNLEESMNLFSLKVKINIIEAGPGW